MRSNDRRPALLRSLLRPDAYPHPVERIALRETHISWVILTGSYAYKIKKPVDFGFVDFSTLQRRRFFCHEELRLNRRFSRDLYLDVVPVTGPADHARMEGAGVAIEYAVKMRQFADSRLFDRMSRMRELGSEHFDPLAERLAAFHAAAEQAPAEGTAGLPGTIRAATEANFLNLIPAAGSSEERDRLHDIAEWTGREYSRLEPFLAERRREGYVRECHGDLHLGNLVLLDGDPTPFDCIEFNPDLRYIDIISEIAFLGMDLEVRGWRKLAYRFLNRYESRVGDYEGLALWDFYRVYRAMVRAKVTHLTMSHAHNPDEMSSLRKDYRAYLDFATALLRPRRLGLVITHGVSGSGKSHVAGALAEQLPGVWLRSDVERKRLHRLGMEDRSGSDLATGIYGEEATRLTYERLRHLAKSLLKARLSVIVDATFLHRWQREQQMSLAAETGADFHLLDVQTPAELLEQRLVAKGTDADNPSEATLAVLQRQLRCLEPLTDAERAHCINVDGRAPDIAALTAVLGRNG